MKLLTIDDNKCRGLYLCDECDPVMVLTCQREGMVKIHDWALSYAERVASRCPDKAITIREADN